MKLKFKADAQDVVIFILFAIFLLYVVALGILNLPSLALNGTFYGINPIPAFAPDKITTTLVFYFLALAALFMSVSSYFFEREKGFGFSTEKTDKGYSRWAKEKEIKDEKDVVMVQIKDEKATAAGVPLILKDNQMWVDNGEYHSLVIGATGSGKTQTVILPTVQSLAKARESMIITDPKGEIYEKTSEMLRDRGYQILLLNFRDPQNGNAWNPLTLPYDMYCSGNQDKAIELLDDLALNILYEESNSNADPFWEKTSADYFSGIALGLFEDAKPEEININSISLMTTVGEEKFGGSTYVKEYFNSKDPASAAAINASSTIMAPNETKGSILAVFKQKIKLFASRENLSEMLSHTDVDLKTIGTKPTALFIVVQDEKKTYHSLVTILLKQVYETLIGVAQENGGRLPVRTNFLLDEFANMPPLKDVTTMITAARSRAIRFTMIIQNFAQLDQVYGKENAETIRGNCGNIIYLITTELKALEEVRTKLARTVVPVVPVSGVRSSGRWMARFKLRSARTLQIMLMVAMVALFFFLPAPIENTEVMNGNYARLLPEDIFKQFEQQSLAITPIRVKSSSDPVNGASVCKEVFQASEKGGKVTEAVQVKPAQETHQVVIADKAALSASLSSAPASFKHYHVIVASMSTETDARQMASRLVDEGYTNACAIIADGKKRVCIESCTTEAEAYRYIGTLREAGTYKDAWVLKREL